LGDVDSAGLGESDLITRSMLAREIRDTRDGIDAALQEVAVTGSVMGTLSEVLSTVPLVTLSDDAAAEAYLTRLSRLGGYLDAVLARHTEAVADGRTPTASGVRQAVAQLDDHLSGTAGDPLLRPAADHETWRRQVSELLAGEVHPALRRHREGLAALASSGRDGDHVGVCHVPGGPEGYLAAVRSHTTTDLTPDEIHQLGLDLVATLRDEFAELGGRVLGTGDVPEVLARLRDDPELRFGSSDQIVDAVTTALRRAEAALPDWFRAYPTAPCVVREMHPSEAAGGVLGYYLPPAGDGGRPGAHVINTYRPRSRPRFEYEALAFHESVPGHHTQVAIAQTLTDLPDFRRYGFITAHGEGWGLYSERLADEMGLYTGDLSRLGMVSFDAWRACRLVVDTGMHHHGWTRQQAIDFFKANAAKTELDITNEIDRYIAWPGQALAYKLGELRIKELRARARKDLGGKFDIRAFHDVVL
ncbi:MAG: DUF885 domain-containing protein, partial [Micromonosporaceae bacterium]